MGDRASKSLEIYLQSLNKDTEDQTFQLTNQDVPADKAKASALEEQLLARGYAIQYAGGALGGRETPVPLVTLQKERMGRGRQIGRLNQRETVPFPALRVHAEAALSLEALINYGKEQGFIRVFEAISSFRSVEDQRRLIARGQSAARGLGSRHLGGLAIDIGVWYDVKYFPELERDITHPNVSRHSVGRRGEVYYLDTRPTSFFKEYGRSFGWYSPDGYDSAFHYQTDITPVIADFTSTPRPQLTEAIEALKEALTTSEIDYVTTPFIPQIHRADCALRQQRAAQVNREALYRLGARFAAVGTPFKDLVEATLRDGFNPHEPPRTPDEAFSFSYATGLWGDGKTGGKL